MTKLLCPYCLQPLSPSDPVYVAHQDTLVCMYYGANKLGFCSKECLENESRLVMEKLRKHLKTKTEDSK